MEESFLCFFLACQKLDVVDEKQICVSVFSRNCGFVLFIIELMYSFVKPSQEI